MTMITGMGTITAMGMAGATMLMSTATTTTLAALQLLQQHLLVRNTNGSQVQQCCLAMISDIYFSLHTVSKAQH